jgi:monoamine oxidase
VECAPFEGETLSEKTNNTVDVLIVGGGISGLYTAWRIIKGIPKTGSEHPGKRIRILESSGRTGGRLLTWRPFRQNKGLHAELGGMRFFRQQKLVWSLIQYFVDVGQLQPPVPFFVNDPNGNNLTYLRQRILKNADLSDPDKVPYMLDASARYAGPGSIVAAVIQWLLVENRHMIASLLNGRTRPTTWEDWDRIKPRLKHNGRRLWDIGFWNLLADLLSPESYNFATDGFGYYSLTNNWNAAEAMQSIFLDFTDDPDYRTLSEGYDYLPALLRKELREVDGEDPVLLHHAATKIDRDTDGTFLVSVRGRGDFRARHLVLAMPRRSLELLDETPYWNWERVVGEADGRKIHLVDYIQSVIPYPAFKLFLAYESPWWRKPPVSIAAGRSISDLPIRQTYYFPPVKDSFQLPEAGSELLKGPGLVMASYDDLGAVSFWRALEVPQDLKPAVRERMKQVAKAAGERGPSKAADHYDRHVAEMNRVLTDEPGFYFAPGEMIRHAQQQLQYVHFNRPIPDPMQNPDDQPGELLAAYKDWGHDPYGGGWNFWAPRVDVKRMMEGIRRPFNDENLYVVGEAYSGNQGWVEGALTTAEKVLRDYFHLEPAPWQPADIYLGY